jgi:hypothetical protein
VLHGVHCLPDYSDAILHTSLDLTVETMVSKTIIVNTYIIFSLSPCIDHIFVTVHNVTKFRFGWSPSHPHSHKSLFFLFPFIKYSPSRNIFQKSGRCLQGSLFHVVFQLCLQEIPFSVLSYCEVYSKLCPYWSQ